VTPEKAAHLFAMILDIVLPFIPHRTLAEMLYNAARKRIDAEIDAEEAALTAAEEITRPERP
jgi:hypothetical protein